MDDRGTTAIRSPGADGSIFPKWCPIFFRESARAGGEVVPKDRVKPPRKPEVIGLILPPATDLIEVGTDYCS